MSEVSDCSDENSLFPSLVFSSKSSQKSTSSERMSEISRCLPAATRRWAKPLPLKVKKRDPEKPTGSVELSEQKSTKASNHPMASKTELETSCDKKTSAMAVVCSPYEKTYSAEMYEPLFEDLEEALGNNEEKIFEYYDTISGSYVLYSETWMSHGIIDDKKLGVPPREWLVLCLQIKRIPWADTVVLFELSKTCQIDEIVKRAVSQWGWRGRFPVISHQKSDLLVKKKETLKALIFVARTFLAFDFLRRTIRSIQGTLRHKIIESLFIIENSAAEKKQKKLPLSRQGVQPAQKAESSQMAPLAENRPLNGITLGISSLASEEESVDLQLQSKSHVSRASLMDQSHSKGPAEGIKKRENNDINDGAEAADEKMRPSKKRRVSADMCSHDPIDDDANLTSTSIMARFDRLEQYFQKGLEAVQQLRLDFQRKDNQYKTALNNKIWRRDPDETGYKEGGVGQANSDTPQEVEDSPCLGLGHATRNVIDDVEGDKSDATSCEQKDDRSYSSREHQEGKISFDEEDESNCEAHENINGSCEHPEERVSVCKEVGSDSESNGFAALDDDVAKSVRSVFRRKVFPRIKMLKSEKQLKKIMRFIARNVVTGGLDSLNIPFQDWAKIYSPEVRKTLASHSAAAQAAMKKAVYSYLDAHNGALVTVEDITKLRECKTLLELNAFAWFWDSLLECVVGSERWGNNKHSVIISGMLPDANDGNDPCVTESDEAFTLLLFENCRDKWIASWKNNKYGTSIKDAALYSARGPSLPGKYHSWNETGMNRFHELCNLVEADRAADKYNQAEKRMLAIVRKNNGLT